MQTQAIEVSKSTGFEYLTSVKIQFFYTTRNIISFPWKASFVRPSEGFKKKNAFL